MRAMRGWLDDHGLMEVSTPILTPAAAEGTTTLKYWSVDRVGNAETTHSVDVAVLIVVLADCRCGLRWPGSVPPPQHLAIAARRSDGRQLWAIDSTLAPARPAAQPGRSTS